MFKILNLIYISFSLALTLKVQEKTTFIRDCNDDYLIGHLQDWGHSYCAHACGSLSDSSIAFKCSDTGICECKKQLSCDKNATTVPNQFGNFCIHSKEDGKDSASSDQIRECRLTCSNLCDGKSTICRESPGSKPTLQGIETRVCACRCLISNTQCKNNTMGDNSTPKSKDKNIHATTTEVSAIVSSTKITTTSDIAYILLLIFKSFILKLIPICLSVLSAIFVIEMYCISIGISFLLEFV